ncbi:MAG: IS982 family transposase [Bacillota bacterium]
MTFEDYLLYLFYLIDTELEAMKTTELPQLRSRGPRPLLYDSEVITRELAGEFLGLDTDKGIYRFFRRYHRGEFPALARVDRTTFVRQAANLWRVKQLLHERFLRRLPLADAVDGQTLWLFDSFPLRVCRYKRAPAHKLFRGLAAYGHDPTGEQCFYGFRVHLRTSDRGFCAQATLAPGNVSDWPLVQELLPAEGGVGLGDRNYWNPKDEPTLRRQGLLLLAPFRKESSDPWPQRSRLLGRLRQIIEPVIGQLATRFHCQRTWARDLWHLCARLGRKLLSHTAAVLLN